MKDDVAIIIPAYNPGECLIELIDKLAENQYAKIIVINDGSKSKEIFEKIKHKAVMLEHTVNQGKGKALKTGFNYCTKNMSNIIGVITVDADGQHAIEDINTIYEKLKIKRDSILLGSRNFDEANIPYRSKFGNKIISKILERKTKINIEDTQTGLRAIPIKYLQELEEISGERFEYETNMLMYCIKNNMQIEEIPINTIYIDKNKHSHFNVFMDSINIYKAVKKV